VQTSSAQPCLDGALDDRSRQHEPTGARHAPPVAVVGERHNPDTTLCEHRGSRREL